MFREISVLTSTVIEGSTVKRLISKGFAGVIDFLIHKAGLIIDNEIVYHIGASLKDLGKNWVAFSKMNLESFDMINRLGV